MKYYFKQFLDFSPQQVLWHAVDKTIVPRSKFELEFGEFKITSNYTVSLVSPATFNIEDFQDLLKRKNSIRQ